MEHFPLIIIGAGPTGLGAAWHWQELSSDKCLVLEASDRAGGLASSFTDEAGFTWDLGSQLHYSHYQYFDDVLASVLDDSHWNHHQRSTFVWFGDRFVPYPFQLNLHHLPPEQRWECLLGLLERPPGPPLKTDFGSWCRSVFGEAITELFMRPYNEKLWACPLEVMTANWIAERVAVPELRDVLRNLCLSSDQTSWGPNAMFRYPRQGGAGSVWKAVASRLPAETIRYHSKVSSIDYQTKTVTCNGERIQYDALLSAVPLPILRGLMYCPEALDSLSRLRHTRTHIVGIGLHGQPPSALSEHCWSYFPQPEIPFYRLTVLSNLSGTVVPTPGNSWSLMAEVSELHEKDLTADGVVSSVIGAIESLGLANRSDILSVWHRRLPFGYPVPSLGRDAILDETNAWLESVDIFSRGRFGAWKYEVSNQDHSFMQGVEFVDRLIHGRKESTLNTQIFVRRPSTEIPAIMLPKIVSSG